MAFKMKGFSGFQNKPTPNKFTGVPGGADVSWRADKHTWEFPEDTKEGQRERREYSEFLNKRSRDRWRTDLKRDRTQSQIIGSGPEGRDAKRGITEIQDPYGQWHRINKKGKFVGSSWGYGPESKKWRNEYNTKLKGGTSTDDGDRVSVELLPEDPRGNQSNGDPELTHKPIVEKPTVEKPTVEKPVKKPKSNFGEMFAAARERGDREFTDPATGKRYHTRRADETMEQWNKKFKRKDGDAGLNRTDRTKISDPTTPAITNFGKKKLKPVKLADLPNLKDKLEEKKDELLG